MDSRTSDGGGDREISRGQYPLVEETIRDVDFLEPLGDQKEVLIFGAATCIHKDVDRLGVDSLLGYFLNQVDIGEGHLERFRTVLLVSLGEEDHNSISGAHLVSAKNKNTCETELGLLTGDVIGRLEDRDVRFGGHCGADREKGLGIHEVEVIHDTESTNTPHKGEIHYIVDTSGLLTDHSLFREGLSPLINHFKSHQ